MIENILNITNSPASIILEVVEKVKKRRLELNITQSSLAKRSDMSLSSYRRFETTGEIAFKSLVHIAIVLDSKDEFLNLFSKNNTPVSMTS